MQVWNFFHIILWDRPGEGWRIYIIKHFMTNISMMLSIQKLQICMTSEKSNAFLIIWRYFDTHTYSSEKYTELCGFCNINKNYIIQFLNISKDLLLPQINKIPFLKFRYVADAAGKDLVEVPQVSCQKYFWNLIGKKSQRVTCLHLLIWN